MHDVGAWTAAIDVCGKAGRVESSAVKLFYIYAQFWRPSIAVA